MYDVSLDSTYAAEAFPRCTRDPDSGFSVAWDAGSDREGVQGAHLNPLGLFLDPPRPLLTRLHAVYMGCSECPPTRLNPLAERTCLSQVGRELGGAAALRGRRG